MYQEEVMVPMGDWKNSRLKNMSDTDKKRDESKVGSGFGKKIENWVARDLAYPTNVLYRDWETDRKSTRLNSSHLKLSRMPSSA